MKWVSVLNEKPSVLLCLYNKLKAAGLLIMHDHEADNRCQRVNLIWSKVLTNDPSEICGRQSLKNLK